MKIYYFANHIYQFSFAMPIYRKIGGTFIVRKNKRIIQSKRYLRNANASRDERTFLNTPLMIKRDIENLYDLKGTVISLSNTRINCDYEKCKTVFIGHGTGDKKYGGNAKILESYDYHFISGPKHLEKIKDADVNIPEKRLIKTGNLRFDDYITNKIDREKILENLGIIDRNRKNVLYAPTWRTFGKGTFHQYIHEFCRRITKGFNLIIRPHYHEVKHIPYVKIWAKFNGIKHLYFSNPSKLITNDMMHDFIASDIMISDTSSILYEYLITGKPIIVAKTDYDKLHQMPDEMNVMKYADIYDGSQDILKLINDSLSRQQYKSEYKRLLNNCFYFNDGKSVERALNFLKSIAIDLGYS